MKPEEFRGRIPVALTRKAVARAVEASERRYLSVVPLPDTARPAWSAARSQAKEAALAVVDVKTPGPTRDAAWAAVAAAMDAAGAYAAQEHILPEVFAELVAPWEHMTTTEPTEGEQP